MSTAEKTSSGEIVSPLSVGTLCGKVVSAAGDKTAKIIKHPATVLYDISEKLKEKNPEIFAKAEKYVSEMMNPPEVTEQISCFQGVDAFYKNDTRGEWRKKNTPYDFVIANAENTDDSKRISDAKTFLIEKQILGHDEKRTPEMEKAFWEAHAYGGDRKPFTSAGFIGGKKLQILMAGGFSKEAAYGLTDAGYCVFGKIRKMISYHGQWFLNAAYFISYGFSPELIEGINNLGGLDANTYFAIGTTLIALAGFGDIVESTTSRKKTNQDMLGGGVGALGSILAIVGKTGGFPDSLLFENLSNIPTEMVAFILLYSIIYPLVSKNAGYESAEGRGLSN